MATALRSLGDGRYEWRSDKDTLAASRPHVAARARSLRVKGRPPGLLSGLGAFTALRDLVLLGSGSIDLGPVATASGLQALTLQLDGAVSGLAVLADLPALASITLTGRGADVQAALASIPWDRARTTELILEAKDPSVIDLAPLGVARYLSNLIIGGAVAGPREMSGEELAALLPAGLKQLVSDAFDDSDAERLQNAARARARRSGPFSRRRSSDFVIDRYLPAGPAPWIWIDPDGHDDDAAWLLEFDAARLVERRTADEEPEANYRAERRLRQLLRAADPTISRRLDFDTTAEALTLALRDGGDRPTVESALHTLKTELEREPTDPDDG